MNNKYYLRGKAIPKLRGHHINRIRSVFTDANRHDRRKRAKLGKLSLREMPGTQWARDRGLHKQKMIYRWRAA
jgi:hypothetical protein